MKIALVQLNPVIGDFKYQCQQIVAHAEKAKARGCDLAVFAEMAVCGYPPKDLLERKSFVEANRQAVEHLVNTISGIGILLGYVAANPDQSGKPLLNAAVLFEDGRVLHQVYKQLLPTYDVFDEARYFEPAASRSVVPFRGECLGIAICEDIWWEKESAFGNRYAVDPLEELRRGNVEGSVMQMFRWATGEFSFEVRDDIPDEEIFSSSGVNPQFLALDFTRLADEKGGEVDDDPSCDSLVFDGEGDSQVGDGMGAAPEVSDPAESAVAAVEEAAVAEEAIVTAEEAVTTVEEAAIDASQEIDPVESVGPAEEALVTIEESQSTEEPIVAAEPMVEPEPLAAAREVFQLIEGRAYDAEFGGYIEARAADWTAASDLRLSDKDMDAAKSMNTRTLQKIAPRT